MCRAGGRFRRRIPLSRAPVRRRFFATRGSEATRYDSSKDFFPSGELRLVSRKPFLLCVEPRADSREPLSLNAKQIRDAHEANRLTREAFRDSRKRICGIDGAKRDSREEISDSLEPKRDPREPILFIDKAIRDSREAFLASRMEKRLKTCARSTVRGANGACDRPEQSRRGGGTCRRRRGRQARRLGARLAAGRSSLW